MGAEDFYWLVEGIIGGMSRPGTRDDLDEDLEALRDDHGVKTVVSLTESPLDADRLAQFDLDYHHLPVADFTAPAPAVIDRVVDLARVAEHTGNAVMVHCAAGRGRTGTVLACVLVSRGLEADDAIEAVRAVRPGSIETAEQVEAVRGYERRSRTDI